MSTGCLGKLAFDSPIKRPYQATPALIDGLCAAYSQVMRPPQQKPVMAILSPSPPLALAQATTASRSVNTAVSALNDAGLPAEAEQVLLAELPRSHSPYYFMLSLAASAKRRNDVAGVLDWYG